MLSAQAAWWNRPDESVMSEIFEREKLMYYQKIFFRYIVKHDN